MQSQLKESFSPFLRGSSPEIWSSQFQCLCWCVLHIHVESIHRSSFSFYHILTPSDSQVSRYNLEFSLLLKVSSAQRTSSRRPIRIRDSSIIISVAYNISWHEKGSNSTFFHHQNDVSGNNSVCSYQLQGRIRFKLLRVPNEDRSTSSAIQFLQSIF